MKVLVGIPYHKDKRYAIDHVLDWIEQQDHPDIEPVIRVHTGPWNEKDAIKTQMEFFRRLALEQNCYLYLMEADTIPPLDAIPALLSHEKDVVGCLYRYRTPDKPYVAWPKDKIKEGSGLIQVKGMGTGAVLLSPSALRAFTFFDWAAPDADYPMYASLSGQGFNIYLDTDLICAHYANEVNYY